MRPIDPLHAFVFRPFALPFSQKPFPVEETTNSDSLMDTSEEPPEAEDVLHFGREWPKILPHLEKDLNAMIAQQRATIEVQKERWRPVIKQEKLGQAKSFYDEFERVLATGTILPSKLGGGGVYILYNALDEPSFIIKPNDEAILCLNNPKHRGSPFNDTSHRLRDQIPLYKTCETEVSVSALSREVGIGHCTPDVRMMILSSPLFYDLSSHLQGKEKELFNAQCGKPNGEKLCSVQRFIPDSLDLQQAMHEWFEAGLEEHFPLPIDQEEFEDVLLLLWLTYDADGHSSNFRVFFKRLDEQHKAVYGIIKIDNGLSLPEENRYLLNYLGYFQNAKLTPSKQLLEKISSIDEQVLDAILEQNHLSYARTALKDRIDVLKILSQRSSITLEEINHRFEFLSLPDGKNLALSPLSPQEITDSLQETIHPASTTKRKSSKERAQAQAHQLLIKV